ncbi:MAG: hypothetical protein ACJAZM_001467 [Cyclobacteriaceae bacterium]|jgi:hypothetical protein
MEKVKANKNELLNGWKSVFNDMGEQLNLSFPEVETAFEKRKKHLISWLSQTEKKLDQLNESGKGDLKKISTKIEDLKVQASLDKANARDAFNTQQDELNLKIHGLNNAFNEIYSNSEGDLKDFVGEAKSELRKIQMRLELFNMQLSLWREDGKVEWDELKTDLKEKLATLENNLSNNKEKVTESSDHFTNEMSQSWQHFKSAFTLRSEKIK